jgi:hypothetical protein
MIIQFFRERTRSKHCFMQKDIDYRVSIRVDALFNIVTHSWMHATKIITLRQIECTKPWSTSGMIYGKRYTFNCVSHPQRMSFYSHNFLNVYNFITPFQHFSWEPHGDTNNSAHFSCWWRLMAAFDSSVGARWERGENEENFSDFSHHDAPGWAPLDSELNIKGWSNFNSFFWSSLLTTFLIFVWRFRVFIRWKSWTFSVCSSWTRNGQRHFALQGKVFISLMNGC